MKTLIRVGLCIAAFQISTVFAQEQRYVEIIVSDTVVLKPISFTYQVSVGESYNYYDLEYMAKDSVDKFVPPEIADIEKDLKKEKFTYTSAGGNDFSISKSKKEKSTLIISLKNKQELERLYKLLSPVKGITGKISDIQFESPEKFYGEMFKRLYEKALSQAASMAIVSGNQLGRMMSVSEVKYEWDGIIDEINKLSKKNPYEFWYMQSELVSRHVRKLQFRFELK